MGSVARGQVYLESDLCISTIFAYVPDSTGALNSTISFF